MRQSGTLTFAVAALALTALATSHGARKYGPQAAAAAPAAGASAALHLQRTAALIPAATVLRPLRLTDPVARRR